MFDKIQIGKKRVKGDKLFIAINFYEIDILQLHNMKYIRYLNIR